MQEVVEDFAARSSTPAEKEKEEFSSLLEQRIKTLEQKLKISKSAAQISASQNKRLKEMLDAAYQEGFFPDRRVQEGGAKPRSECPSLWLPFLGTGTLPPRECRRERRLLSLRNSLNRGSPLKSSAYFLAEKLEKEMEEKLRR